MLLMPPRLQTQLIRIGTRPSPLALIQAEQCAKMLQNAARANNLSLRCALHPVASKGDRVLDKPLWQIGGREIFVGALEEALLADQVDVAVHSLKDMPHQQPDSLCIAAIPERGATADALLGKAKRLDELPKGARLGTASPRRQAQLRAFWPHLQPVLLRGNIGTRLEKIRAGEVDAALVAEAGLQRLGLEAQATPIPPETLLPAAGQGALAFEVKKTDADLLALLKRLNHAPSVARVVAERSFSAVFGASCRIAVAALAELRPPDRLFLRAHYYHPEGKRFFAFEGEGEIKNPEQLGQKAAADIKANMKRAGFAPKMI